MPLQQRAPKGTVQKGDSRRSRAASRPRQISVRAGTRGETRRKAVPFLREAADRLNPVTQPQEPKVPPQWLLLPALTQHKARVRAPTLQVKQFPTPQARAQPAGTENHSDTRGFFFQRHSTVFRIVFAVVTCNKSPCGLAQKAGQQQQR